MNPKTRCTYRGNLGRNAIYGINVTPFSARESKNANALSYSGYLESCRSIVTTTRKIADAIRTEIPDIYVLGSPPASVVAFASKRPDLNVLEVGDAMSKRGWHLNALAGPPAVHIAVTVCMLTDSFQCPNIVLIIAAVHL